MFKIFPVVEFYITNVCNLACKGCNRFNNYHFKGHQLWEEYADAYEAWSKRLELPRITILGGEPTLNPNLELWAKNLRRLWPDSVIMVQSNGTYLRPEHFDLWFKYRVGFGISLHNPATAEEIKNRWHLNGFPMAGFIEAFTFHQSSVIERDGYFELHNSDPEKAFNCCDMKHDHTMYQGKLYKCPAMSNLPDFDQQFDLRITEKQRELLYSYKPLSHVCDEEELQKFLLERDRSIPQCEFCPDNLIWHDALGPNNNVQKPTFIPIVQEEDLHLFK